MDAVAIVGMAFRFPGGMESERDFWEALRSGSDLITEIPVDRWAVEELRHPKRAEAGRSITFSAGVLSRIDEFDAHFFGISPREAAWMDPQQRLLLELAWESLEDAGQMPSALAGTDCAVYVGIAGLDYGTRVIDDLAGMSSHSMTGNTLSIAANRLSYVLDLHGPSLAVDTACSSSLVALHHACNSLRSGEADSALVGGVSLLLHPYPFVGFTKASMLSAQGRCKAFDASGDGYVRAEGGAVLFLKPLSRALADGDDIKAVILASGVNADGARKTGITIPSVDGQSELMRAVLKRSGLAAEDIDFVEAHGTGTAVGDPVETAAIGQVYGKHRSPDRPLPIGSVKTNLGHMEAASGMAGLIKAVLCLRNRALPPSLHLVTPNPRIDFAGLNLEVVTRHTQLVPKGNKPLVAGVNSFGFGGANAHVLLQEAPIQSSGQPAVPPENQAPLFLSARTHGALRDMARNYADMLRDVALGSFTPYDLAYSATQFRERMEKRLAVHAGSIDDWVNSLSRFADGEEESRVLVEERLPETGGVAFVYSGNGAQWHGMGRLLLGQSPRFVEIIDELDAAIRPLAGFSVLAELQDDRSSRLDDTTVAQPMLFAMQVAVTLMLRERGVRPTAVTGHSVGEVAAAWCAGALDLDQAVRVICARSAAQGLTRGTGRMAAVAMSPEAIQAVMQDMGGALDIELAGINSANNVTLSGSLADLERLRAHLEPKGIFFRLLDLDYAFHSARMDVIEGKLLESLADLRPVDTQDTAFVSTVTGHDLAGGSLGADYWWHNVRQPVQFAGAMDRLIQLGNRIFIEIGPHAILQRYMAECLKVAHVEGRILSTLRRDDDGLDRIEEAALRVHMLVDKPDLQHYFPVVGQRVSLPRYPWQRERHWHPTTSEGQSLIQRRREHPLLGWRLHDAEAGWENTLDTWILPWLADHQVGEAVVFPGAAYAEMVLAAARSWYGKAQLGFEELDIISPLVFDGEHARTVRFTLNTRDGSFQITSRQRLSEDEWTLHAAGRLLDAPQNRQVAARIPPASHHARVVDHATHYALTAALGLGYGPAFQGIREVRIDGEVVEARLSCPAVLGEGHGDYLLHPALLDLPYQALVDVFQSEIEAGKGVAFLPVKIGALRLYGSSRIAQARIRLLCRSLRSVLADIELFDAEGGMVASMAGCRFRAAPLMSRHHAAPARWKITPRLQPHPLELKTTQLMSPLDLAGRLRDRLERGAPRPARQTWFQESLPLFEALTLSFIYEAFEAVASDGEDALQTLMQTQIPASPYLRWLASLLMDENLLAEHDGVWRLGPRGELPRSEVIWQTLMRETPACSVQLTLLGHLGRQLAGVLRGEVAVEELARSLRRSPVAETLLDDDPAYLGTRLAVQVALVELDAHLPQNRKLRVLEIAAGASEMPRHLAQTLHDDRMEYVLALADEETRQRQQIEFQDEVNVTVLGLDTQDWKLSIENAALQPFDVVILRHVVHQAAFPHAALAHARRWLAQGGLLILAERHADWSADVLGGLESGWWNDAESGAFKPVSSLQPPQVWLSALTEEGFEDVEAFIEPDARELQAGAYVLLARRPHDAAPELAVVDEESWALVVDDSSAGFAQSLQRLLEGQGQRVLITQADGLAQAGRFDHAVWLLGWKPFSPEDGLHTPALLPDLVHGLLDGHGGHTPKLWIVTHGGALVDGLDASVPAQPHQGAVWGFGRVLMNEYPALDCTLIDVACDMAVSGLAERFLRELLQPDGANAIVLTDDARYVLRMENDQPQAGGTSATAQARYRLDFRVPGKLRNLLWLPKAERSLADHEIEVMPRATGLNFRDVMYLMGLLPDEAVEKGFAGASLGLEFAGVVSRVGASVQDVAPGDAVMGFGSSCFASHVVTRADAVARIPDGWTFADAATVPTVFFTVYYALKHLADLQPGERVLIHGAAGGVGIAAIQLARHLGAEIFATAGSEEKRDFVRLLGADHVFDSRSLDFADDVLEATGFEGVDVVLNSLAGEAIRRNLRILKPFGRFIELGKRDFFENTPIGLRPFKDNISYFGVDADQLLTGRPALAAQLFRELMALFHARELTPLPHRAFGADRVVDAFRVMQQSRHIGKIVVTLDQPPSHIEIDHVPGHAPGQSPVFERNSTWLVTGGLGGFGLETARRLAERGVGQLVLLGRRGAETPGAMQAIEELQAAGTRVTPMACDITDADALADVLAHIGKTMPPLKGIVHAAMVIDDALIANLDASRMEQVLRPKVLGAWNLHTLTRDMPIEHFVMYSSVTTFIGNPGQANYVAANGALEALARMRRGEGLPATCIGWGPIGDAGYLTRFEAVKDSLEQRLGKPPLASGEALDQLEELLGEDAVIRAVADFDWPVLSRLLPSSKTTLFDELNRHAADTPDADQRQDIRVLLAGKTPHEIREILRDMVTQEISQILSISSDRIEPNRSLHDLGMDSLMAVELAMSLEQRFGIRLPVMMLNESPTAEKVTARIMSMLFGEDDDAEKAAESIDTLVQHMVRQHGESISEDEIAKLAEEARSKQGKAGALV